MALSNLLQKEPSKTLLILAEGKLATSFYMPPLLGINVLKEYGAENFIKALIVPDTLFPQIVCFVSNRTVAKRAFDLNPNYVSQEKESSIDGVSITRILYNIPKEFHSDFYRYAAGKYSRMSVAAKEKIRTVFKAGYMVKSEDGTVKSDKRLHVLDKAPALRKYMEEILDTMISEDAELLDRPGYDNFWWGDN